MRFATFKSQFMKGSIREITLGCLLVMLSAVSAYAQTQPIPKPKADTFKTNKDVDFSKVDQELNRMYEQILLDYSGDSLFIRRFKESERAWLSYRDAEMVAIYPHLDSAKEIYGSVFPTCWDKTLAQLEQERINTLKSWCDGKAEGDVCTGSAFTPEKLSAIHKARKQAKQPAKK